MLLEIPGWFGSSINFNDEHNQALVDFYSFIGDGYSFINHKLKKTKLMQDTMAFVAMKARRVTEPSLRDGYGYASPFFESQRLTVGKWWKV